MSLQNDLLISIVIPTYNEEKDIAQCIQSLQEQITVNKEIIIVDDGSTDNTLNIIKQFDNITIIQGTHNGPGFSRNIGANVANGKILIFVDADMTFEKDYLKNLIAPLFDQNIIGTTHDYEIVINTSNWISNLWGPIRVSKEQAKDVKIFRAIRKDKFLELGGFDPKFSYADDQSLFLKYGIKPIVAHNTTCYHKNPETLKATYKQARWIGASWMERFKIFKIPIIKHIGVIGLFILLPFIIILKSLRSPASFIRSIQYFSCKFYGYAVGLCRRVYLGETSK